MRIQHNIMAMNAYRNYNNNTKALSKNLERLSSGYKINRAGDDAAGLAISEKMRAQITGLEAAQKNVKDGISLVNTAEGAMQEIHDMLNRMVYLATQSANGTYDNEVDRANLQKEVDSLKEEINRIADSANFNGIKLLDGSLDADGTASITTQAVDYVDHAGLKGITLGDVENGSGSKGTYTISIDELFGNGDKLTFSFDSGSGFVATASGNTPASVGATNTSALKAKGSLDLTFKASGANGTTEFEGKTLEEQAASIAEALKSDTDIAAQFNVTTDGNKVILTNINEGNDQATISSVKAEVAAGTANVQASLDTPTTVNAGAGTAGTITFANLFKNNGGLEFNVGDTLTFDITDANGNKWSAELLLTDEIISQNGDDHTTQQNIIQALNSTDPAKAVYFKANSKTAAAEETIKFSELFSAAFDGTDDVNLKLTAQDAGGIFATGNTMTITTTGGTSKSASVASATPGAAASAVAQYEVNLSTSGTNPDNDFSVGDKLTIKGYLSDGRKFEFDLVAGTDFDIGAAHTNTVDNIRDALCKGTGTVAVEDADGNVEQVAMNKIFSSTANKNEILVSNNGGKLKFTSQVEGNVKNGYIDDVSLTAAKAGAVSPDLRNGVQKTAATSSLSFNSELKLGDTVTVGGNTYQFVENATDAEAGNTAIVIADPKDSAAVAQAFADQLNQDAGTSNPAYTAKAVGDTVTITTTDKGQGVEAISIDALVTHKDAVFQLQPNKMKTGSTITVNGKTFEFVDTKDSTAELSNADNIRVDVDLTKGDTVEINQALKDAIEAAGIAGIEEINIDDEGTLRICGDGTIDPTITFENGKPLTLQIGDTSDNYNQLKVKVSDMHTWAMGIADIDISNQEGAQAAIDVIRNAINYVSSTRGDLGAVSNRLDHTANNLSVMAENIQDAESTIRDTDVAEEMMAYTKNNILVQSAQAMLAQANQVPQGVLQLLQ